MIASQRQREIAAHIRGQGGAKVSDLARFLGVTEETIRRDLRHLAEQGELLRTHGGAVAAKPDDGRSDLPYHHRRMIDRPQKRAIAAVAVEMVKPGEVIALDASSTACELAFRLPNEPLTVVTNSLTVCSALARKDQITTICTGGTLDPAAMAFHGPQAERAIEHHHIHQAFFSCRGIDLQRGLSEACDSHAAIKLRLIEAAQRCVLLADASKFALTSLIYFAPATRVDALVTDRSDGTAAIRALDHLRAHGVQIHEAEVKV